MTTGPSSETSPSGARESAAQGGAAAAVPPLAPGPARMVVLAGAVLALLSYLCGFFGASGLSSSITFIVGGGVLGLLALLPGVGRVLPAAVAISVTGFLFALLTQTSAAEFVETGAVGWVGLAFGFFSAAALVGALLLDVGLISAPAPRPARDHNAGPQGAWGQPGYGPAPGQSGYGAPGGYPQQPGYGDGQPGQAGAFGQAPGYAPQGYGPGYSGGYAPQGYGGPGYGGAQGQGAHGGYGYGAAQPGYPGAYPGAPVQGQEQAGQQQPGGSLFAASGSGTGAPQPLYGAAPGPEQGQGQGQPGQGQAGQQQPGAGQYGPAGSASWAGPDATSAVPAAGQGHQEKRPDTLVEGADDERTHSFRPDGDGKNSAS